VRRLAIAVAVVVMATACVGDGGELSGRDASNTVGRCRDIVELRKLREELTPDAGHRVTVRPLGPNGEAVEADPTSCLRTTSPGVDIATARSIADEPAVAMLVDPGTTPTEATASADAAVDIVGELAPDVDLAVFGLGPIDDGYSAPAVVTEAPAPWELWTTDEAPPEGWDRNPLLTDDRFDSVPTPLLAVPPELAAGPVLARSTLMLDEAVDPEGLMLTGSHTGGLVLRVAGTEVVRSNLPAGPPGPETAPLAATGDPVDFAVTVEPSLLGGRDIVVSIEWFGASSGSAAPFFEFEAVDRRSRPIAAAPLTGFGRDRRFAIAQIESRKARPLAPDDLAPAAGVVAAHLDDRRERSSDGPELLVVVAPHRKAEELPDFGGDPIVVWVGDGTGGVVPGVHRAVDSRPGVGDSFAEFVEAHRRAGVWSVGLCGPLEPTEPVIGVADTPAETSPELVAPLGTGPCDASSAVAGTPAVTTLRLDLTDDQQRVFDQRGADRDRRPVGATLEISAGFAMAAEVQIRGQSTLDCERKSYSVSLSERVPVPLVDGWQPSEFTLLSLCLDEGYLRTLTTFRLLEALGLSDLRMSLVDLVVADVDRGVYLLIERADDLSEHHPTAAAVIRRRLDRSVQVSEVEWTSNRRPDLAFDEYESLIEFAEAYDGDDLAGALDERLDLDQYLRWLALMSLLQNGDYSDEAFFVGDPVVRGTELGLRWHLQPWDPDDMFQPCHLDGVLEIVDRAGLTSCAESRIDAAILGDDGVLARYQTQLDRVLDEITPDRFATTMDEVRTEFDAVLPASPQVVMTELASTDGSVVDAESFGAALDRNQAVLVERFRSRSVELVDRVRERGGPFLADDVAATLTLRAPTHASANGALPVVVEARTGDGTIDRSVSGLVELQVRGAAPASIPITVRRGRGSTTVDLLDVEADSVSLSVGTAPAATVTIDSADRTTREFAGDLTGDDLQWGPDETIVLVGDTRVPAGSTLVIEPGTRVEVSSLVDIEVRGTIDSRATDVSPIVFVPAASLVPWGGIVHLDGTGTYDHTWFVAGGGRADRAFGHSGSQPVILASSGAEVSLDHAVFQDGPGKGPSGHTSTVTISNSLVTRLDTGGEFIDTAVTVDDSWYLDFPDPDRAGDDDNDAIYLARESSGPVGDVTATVRDSVFFGGADDGIDHNGADVTLERLWIEGFAHECVAFSAGGLATLSDSVLSECEQGVEIGYGSPEVIVDHVVVMGNDVGVRYGDDYRFEYSGSITVSNSIVVDNVDDVLNFVLPLDGPAPDGLRLRQTLLGSPDDGDDAADVMTGMVTFTDRLLLGPRSPGVGRADDGSDLGLVTGRPR